MMPLSMGRWSRNFNPRPREGGATLYQLPRELLSPHFNPRPREGGATAKMHSFTCGSLTNK